MCLLALSDSGVGTASARFGDVEIAVRPEFKTPWAIKSACDYSRVAGVCMRDPNECHSKRQGNKTYANLGLFHR